MTAHSSFLSVCYLFALPLINVRIYSIMHSKCAREKKSPTHSSVCCLFRCGFSLVYRLYRLQTIRISVQTSQNNKTHFCNLFVVHFMTGFIWHKMYSMSQHNSYLLLDVWVRYACRLFSSIYFFVHGWNYFGWFFLCGKIKYDWWVLATKCQTGPQIDKKENVKLQLQAPMTNFGRLFGKEFRLRAQKSFSSLLFN